MGEGGNSVFFWVFVGRWLDLRLFECLVFFLCCVRMKKIYINTFYIYFWFF